MVYGSLPLSWDWSQETDQTLISSLLLCGSLLGAHLMGK